MCVFVCMIYITHPIYVGMRTHEHYYTCFENTCLPAHSYYPNKWRRTCFTLAHHHRHWINHNICYTLLHTKPIMLYSTEHGSTPPPLSVSNYSHRSVRFFALQSSLQFATAKDSTVWRELEHERIVESRLQPRPCSFTLYLYCDLFSVFPFDTTNNVHVSHVWCVCVVCAYEFTWNANAPVLALRTESCVRMCTCNTCIFYTICDSARFMI